LPSVASIAATLFSTHYRQPIEIIGWIGVLASRAAAPAREVAPMPPRVLVPLPDTDFDTTEAAA